MAGGGGGPLVQREGECLLPASCSLLLSCSCCIIQLLLLPLPRVLLDQRLPAHGDNPLVYRGHGEQVEDLQAAQRAAGPHHGRREGDLHPGIRHQRRPNPLARPSPSNGYVNITSEN